MKIKNNTKKSMKVGKTFLTIQYFLEIYHF